MEIIIVRGQIEGSKIAKEILYRNVGRKTVLFLSGGSTPKNIYQKIAKEKILKPGAAGIVDERYFEKSKIPGRSGKNPWSVRQKSKIKFTNEKMIEDTGLMSYFSSNGVIFYPILENKSLEETVRDYNNVVQNLFRKFSKKVAIMGIGEDGHTAGIPVRKSQISNLKSQNYVAEFRDFPGEFKERISLTFKALSQMDLLIVLVFGEEKRKALKLLFSKGPIEEIPARFFRKPDIAPKTLLITDQKV